VYCPPSINTTVITEDFSHHAAVLLWEWFEALFALGGALNWMVI